MEVYQKYLYANVLFSPVSINIWQEKTQKRMVDREKDEYYYQYINWQKANNEVAVFTMYAYDDLELPKNFDCIFDLDNPSNYIHTSFILTQGIWEAWFPMNMICSGHKHLCIFTFENKIPDIFNKLYVCTTKYPKYDKIKSRLGFCQQEDFEEIRNHKFYTVKKYF